MYQYVVRENNKKLKRMLELSRKKIIQQGCGCFIPGYGVSYSNQKNNTKDSIGILFDKTTNINYNWGPINEESQKNLVKELIIKFNIDIGIVSELVRFNNFLNKLQIAHDVAFDEFLIKVDEDNRIDKFSNECDIIIMEFML